MIMQKRKTSDLAIKKNVKLLRNISVKLDDETPIWMGAMGHGVNAIFAVVFIMH